jgi:hypothetical protein
VHESWVQTYQISPTLNHYVAATAVAPSGSVYVAAGYNSASQATEPLVLKYASDGTLLWSRTYTSYVASIYNVAIDPNDESAYVFGRKPHYTPYDSDAGIVLKYDASGNLAWSQLYQLHAEFPFDAAYFSVGRLAPNGDLVLAATSPRGLSVVRYDPSGILRWSALASGVEYPEDVVFDPFGDIVVPAVHTDAASAHHFGVAKVSGAGSFLWTRIVTGGGSGDEYARSATTDPTGSIYAVGWLSDPATGQNGAVVKLDSNGNVLWTRLNYGSHASTTYPSVLYAAELAPNGNVRVGGHVNNIGTNSDVRVLEYTAQGDLVWQSDWDDGADGYEIFRGMRSGPDGSLTAFARVQDYHGNYTSAVIEWDAHGALVFGAIDPVPSAAGLVNVGAFGADGVVVLGGVTFDSPPKTSVAYEREQALAFCFGDGSNGACPCGNQSAAGYGNGCANSIGAAARLAGNGSPLLANDTLVLTSSGEVGGAASIFLQGSATTAPSSFGDGLLCVGQNLKRLYVHAAQTGSVSAPAPGEPSISAQSAAQGDSILAGTTRYYQVYYRDHDGSFCPPPAGSTWNASSGLAVTWY